MKIKFAFAFFLMTLFVVQLSAQKEPFGHPRIRQANSIVWFGLDFSKAQLIGSEGFTDPVDIKERFFDKWNRLIIDEADKYNFRRTFQKESLEYDLSVVEERNKMPEADELVINSEYSLSQEEAEAVVSQYRSSEFTEGLGLVFVIESFNKPEQKGHMWVTFFDIATHEIVLIKKYSGEAGGFGLRNYWARSVYEVIEQLEKGYKIWLKKNKK